MTNEHYRDYLDAKDDRWEDYSPSRSAEMAEDRMWRRAAKHTEYDVDYSSTEDDAF